MTTNPDHRTPHWFDLLDSAGLLAVVLDARGRVVDANRALRSACACMGGPQEGVDWVANCLAPDDAPARERVRAWLEGGCTPEPLEAVMAGHHGQAGRLIRWNAHELPGVPGGTHGVALLGHDITRQRADEQRTRRLTDFYRALSDMGQAIVRIGDAHALYQQICEIVVERGHATMAWLGLIADGKVVPMAWGGPARAYTDGLVIPAYPLGTALEGELGPTATAVASGHPYICNDYLADRRTGPWRKRAMRHGVRASAAFPVRRSGHVVGTLNIYFSETDAFDRDLVELLERMVADLCFALEHIDQEAAREHAEQEARERALQLSGIVETALDAIITVNAEFKVVVFNGAAAHMFGVTPLQAIGGTIDRFIPAVHRAAHRSFLADYAAHGASSRRMGHARELSGLRANGEVFPLEASISRAGEGERMLMTVMARDVTQLRLGEKAHLARTAAEAANRAKTEFLSRISHELRTPLNAVLGFAQLMRTDSADPLSGHHRAQVDLVLQAGEHLRTLIDEMLDVSRIEAGGMSMEVRDFELCELLDGVLRMSEPHANECKVRLEAGYVRSCTMLMRSDPARLRQVMFNLISNGIKYNRPGGWVRVELMRDPYFVHIVVRDNGLGMDEKQRAQLFEPFNRLGREHSAVPGTGIGLVLVRQLVGLMGGELTIDSTQEAGTAVRITLPATDGRPMASASKSSAKTDGNGDDLPGGVVLYIEDNPVNAILVEQLLARWPKVQLIVAPDGTTGLERARAAHPDLVLLDMQLPDMGGLEVLQRLKGDPATQHLRCVALSASALPQEVEQARQAGALDYWTKPIDFGLFADGMRRLLVH